MTEKSIVFDFIRYHKFFDDMNQSGKFNVNDMDGTSNNYEFILMSNCDDDISDVTVDGFFPSDYGTVIDIGTSGQVALSYTDIGDGNREISTPDSAITLNLGDNDYFLKAMFLVDISTRYILAYCIMQTKIPVTNQIVFPASSIVWNLRNEA